MQVRLKVFSALRRVVGKKSLSLEMPEESTVRDLLWDLNEKYGSTFQRETGKTLFDRVVNRLNVFLNDRLLKLPGQLSVVLKEDDEITILEPSGGG